MGTFDLVGFKVSLGSFGAHVLKCPMSQKPADSRAKIWESGTQVTYMGTFELVVLKVFGGHSVQFSQNGLQLEKGAS